MNKEATEAWIDFKKEMTWNNIKCIISGVLPLIGFFYLWSIWGNLVSPIMNEYSNATNKVASLATTQHDAIISLCLVAGFVAPIFLAFPILSFGLWVGRITKFYRDDKTRYFWWDNKYYNVRDMPEQERSKVADLLSNYKSKTQLRKEKLTNESWLRRNFS